MIKSVFNINNVQKEPNVYAKNNIFLKLNLVRFISKRKKKTAVKVTPEQPIRQKISEIFGLRVILIKVALMDHTRREM